MNANTKLSPSYDLEGAMLVREAFEFVGFSPSVSIDGYLEVRTERGRMVRIVQNDNQFEVVVLDGFAMLESGRAKLQGSFASVVMLAALLVEVSA